MIEVENLSKNFGPVSAISDVSFSVQKGEILGFLGPNGAGKTTTMRILTGFIPATSGSARVAGFDVFTQSLEVRRRIGYLPERVPLYSDMTTDGYLKFVAKLKGVPARSRANKIEEVKENCGIVEISGRFIGKLSRGYRQRVGIAQALINDPEVLILDEPTVGLDPKQIKEIRNLIRGLAGKKTIILSTHMLTEVSMICDSVAIINEGRIAAKDSISQLSKEPQMRIHLTLANAPAYATEPIISTLSSIAGVEKAEPSEREEGDPEASARFEILSESGADPRAEVSAAIIQNGWKLVELWRERYSLEDIFINTTAREPEVES
jgi:ABC-type multidrug transport system ATPase subunit